MKQLADEVFAQVRDALASARVYMNHVAVANWQTPAVICSEALAALDTAQPEQPIACMVKGKLLSYKDSLIPEDCFLYLGPQPKQAQPEPVELTDEQITVIGNNHSNWDAAMTFDVWPVFARAILAAAKQAQPERAPSAWVSESGEWVTTSKVVVEHHEAKGHTMTPLYK